MKILSDPVVYYEIKLPFRNNVREPMPKPVLVLLRHDSDDVCSIELTEGQLFAIIRDASATLDSMRLCRNATVPS
jgi:hypothetical protein